MSESTVAPRRDHSIDVLRGLVMCLMVLDHARDFATSSPFNATDASKTNAALFFTRWVTHFCAPIFMLLAGAGAGLSRRKGGSLSRFLLSRGLWLIFLEVTWVRFGWTFNLTYEFTTAQVIWALGWSMIFLAAIVPFGPRVALIVGVIVCVFHNLLDPIDAMELGRWGWLWQIAHSGGPIEVVSGHSIMIAYPLVPWIGVIAGGYWLGSSWRSLERRSLLVAGVLFSIAFIVLRGIDRYGDPHPWVLQTTIARDAFAFLACEKYPPSLDYLLMTLGPALIFLGFAKGRDLGGPLLSIGRAPLFFYLLHIPLVHFMVTPLRLHQHLPPFAGMFRHGLVEPLWVAYVVWLIALAILYLPTQRWAQLKADHPDWWWLSYL